MRGGLTALACCALAAIAIGCGGGDSSGERPDTTSSATTTTAPEPPRPTIVPSRWRQPRIRPHPSYRSDRVVVRDIAKGTGPAVGPHDYVLMDYVEGDYRRGTLFYDAWDEPGAVAGVILAPRDRWRGLTIGMRGMRVGGRRQIVVPPRLGGIEPGHADWNNYLVWDVALRGIHARGCDDAGSRCRSDASNDPELTFAPNPYREPGRTAPHAKPLRRLIVHDVKRGRGPALEGDEVVYADLVKTFWRSGAVFLDEWGPRRTGYLLLASQAPGMRRGMIGMRPGGRRTIAMPGSISDVHSPDRRPDYVAAQVDVVLRKIVSD